MGAVGLIAGERRRCQGAAPAGHPPDPRAPRRQVSGARTRRADAERSEFSRPSPARRGTFSGRRGLV